MARKYSFILFLFLLPTANAQKTIHVFVALCDNQYQGIVPVPPKIGNGQNPTSNLYWGAGYGVKNFFKVKSPEWQLIRIVPSDDPKILERLLFKHKSQDSYLLAEAYDGRFIKSCIEDFLLSSNGQRTKEVSCNERKLQFGGQSNLVAYVGHNGLMDFDIDLNFTQSSTSIDAILLCCYAKQYFTPHLQAANATPILWTTHLMAPEAYTLEAAISKWLQNAATSEIESKAETTYQRYQKCSLSGARNLFTTGF